MSDLNMVLQAISKIESQLEKIDEKVDSVDKTLAVQEKTLQVQAEQLAEHIRRTNLLEERVEQAREELRPVEQHVEFVNRLGKLILAFAAIGGSIQTVLKLLL